jgi:amidase
MSTPSDLTYLDATALAELVAKKAVTPLELAEAVIARIERLNPTLNAVITPMYDQARAAAKGKIPDGPFRGVPYLMKDIGASVGGVRMAMGTAALKDFVPDHDAELTIRLKKAGLIIVGKTNTPELGLLPSTEPRLFGPTRNPWNTSRITGGSSGGAAASVASGILPMAHANDGGGSIRIPASCCGVFGLKPTRARNPLGPDTGDMLSGLVCEHAVTRSVRDSAALLDATSGPDIGDPYWAPPPARPFLKEVGADPGRLRIAFSLTTATGTPVHPDCEAMVKDVAALCADLGHAVEEAGLPSAEGMNAILTNAFMVVWLGGCAANVNGIYLMTGKPPSAADYEPLTWALYERGKVYSASDYLIAVRMLQLLARGLAHFFETYDLLLTPVVAEPPVPLGTFDAPPDDPMKAWERVAAFAPFTPIFNATGQPAMSVPLYWNREGLPIGAHFVARFGDEATLFRLAAQLETARPWAGRRPPVSA